MAVFLCPLCSQTCFHNLEALRFSLIKAATQNISCPICDEILVGLDKFTIHLFGHGISQSTTDDSFNLKMFKIKENRLPFTLFEKTKVSPATEFSLNVENFFDVSELEKQKEISLSKSKDSNCKINMEDVGFLPFFESYLKDDSLALEEKNTMETNVPPVAEDAQEHFWKNNVELSEYMSDLLNKKLPIIEFTRNLARKTNSNPTLESENGTKHQQQLEFSDSHLKLPDSFSPSERQESNCRLSESSEGTEPAGSKVQNKNHNFSTESNLSKEIVFENLMLPHYDCHLCKKSFKMKGSLLVHYKMAHLGLSNLQNSSPTECQEETDNNNFQCSICNKSFKKDQYLMQHIRTHEEKQWHCETCNKYFTTKYFLKKHQRLHTGEMPYSCQKCNKTFTFQQSYHKHLLYHSDVKPYKCTQCGKAFKELSTLHNHQRIHSGEKPFACETCGKCFRQRVSYIVHRRIHTGVLPYECGVCQKKFRYKVSQRNHKCALQPLGTITEPRINHFQAS